MTLDRCEFLVVVVVVNPVPKNPVPENPVPENPVPENPVPENPVPENPWIENLDPARACSQPQNSPRLRCYNIKRSKKQNSQ